MSSIFAVMTPAADTSLLTTEELRAAAGVSDATQDQVLAALGKQVALAIARQCCIADDGVNPPTLMQETCTETFRLHGVNSTLRLSRRPVASITSVTENGSTLDAGDYEVSKGSGLLSRLSGDCQVCWPCGKITVVYMAGYATAPDDLKLAASKLVAALYTEAGEDQNLKRLVIPGVEERDYWVGPVTDPLISTEIADLIAPYRQYWL